MTNKKVKRRTTKKTPNRAKRTIASVGGRFETDLRLFKKEFASARPRVRRDGSPVALPESVGVAANSTVVPRSSVGAAVQAAISFEQAKRVVAVAIDDTRTSFQISWV